VLATPLPPPPGLWIYVNEWNEGIARWSRSFSELIVLAKKFNATVVEPCIKNGRLVPCGQEQGNLTLGEVFDVSSFRPWLGSQDEFERRAAVSHTERMCMHKKSVDCKGRKGVKQFYHKPRSNVLENAVIRGRTSASVLEIYGFTQSAFLKMKLKYVNATGIGDGELMQIRKKLMQFKQEHKDYARAMLKRLGVEKPYSVIHWRAETKGMGK
jgi:hypothetical protein